jgi:hypothetical protein
MVPRHLSACVTLGLILSRTLLSPKLAAGCGTGTARRCNRAATELQQSCKHRAATKVAAGACCKDTARRSQTPPTILCLAITAHCRFRASCRISMYVCVYIYVYAFSCAKAAALLALTKRAEGWSGRLQHGERSSLSDPTHHPFTASLQTPTPPPAQTPHRHGTLRRYLP